MLRRVSLLLGALAFVVAACGTADGAESQTDAGTVPVGGLPPTFATTVPDSESAAPPPAPVRTTTPIPPDAQVGRLVEGNRVIMIGDSVMAATSRRYSNDMCNALVPLGWEVEVDAETGRFVEFGDEVLDARLSAGWDAAVILLGNNYREDQAAYAEDLEGLVDRLSPRPVVLLTVTEFTPSRAKVNEVIFDIAERHDNVLIVDWGATTAADPDLTGGDGLHLTTKGREALAGEVTLALGEAPKGPGKCLETEFQDDSSGSINGTTTTAGSTRTTRPQSTTATTGAPTTEPPTSPPGT